MRRRFANRSRAAHELARELIAFASHEPVVIGVPPGGVEVAGVVADALGVQLDVALVHRLIDPSHPTQSIGSVDVDGRAIYSVAPPAEPRKRQPLRQEAWFQRKSLERWAALLERRKRPALGGQLVIVVDDGATSGATVRGAVHWVRAQGASSVVVALPVITPMGRRALAEVADNVVALQVDDELARVADAYVQFNSLSEGDVVEIVREFDQRRWRRLHGDEEPSLDDKQWWTD